MNDPQRTFTLFEELFRGSSEAYGLVHGECVRARVTEEHWRDHLFGSGSLGIYPTIKLRSGTIDGSQLLCRWACSDIDTHGPRAFDDVDARTHAMNVCTALGVLGHQGHIELTKSRGYHVWLFAQDWVDAQIMRSVLLLAHQLADVPAYEVNPKDALGATELGNYVNLPYAAQWSGKQVVPGSQATRVIVDLDTGEPLSVSDFVESAHQARSPVRLVHETASLWVPPSPPAPVTMRAFSGLPGASQGAGTDPGWNDRRDIEDPELREAAGLLSGKGWTIFRYGPNQGGRALTLFRLGVECRESGLNPDEAMLVLVDADWRWGKFMGGHDGHTNGIRYIEDICRKVYG